MSTVTLIDRHETVLVRFYRGLIRFGIHLAPFVLLLIRLAWGYELVQAGHGHLMHLDKTTDFFASLHIPMPRANAIICGSTELVGGILLIVGLGSRLIAIPLIFNFIVAYVTDGRDAITQIFTAPEKFVDYAAFPFLVTALVVLAFGPGWISLDGLLERLVFRKKSVAVA